MMEKIAHVFLDNCSVADDKFALLTDRDDDSDEAINDLMDLISPLVCRHGSSNF